MGRHLHKNIGEQFSEKINSMHQQPRGHIWENINRELDSTDAKNDKDKFTRLRKRTRLLLLLLIGISTFSVIYFNASKNKKADYNLAERKGINEINNDNSHKPGISVQQEAILSDTRQKQNITTGVSGDIIVTNQQENLFLSPKPAFIKKGKTNIKITDANTAEDEKVADTETEPGGSTNPVKIIETGVTAILSFPANTEKSVSQIIQPFKNNLIPEEINNQPAKTENKKQRYKHSKFTLTAFAGPDMAAYRLENDELNNYDSKSGIAKRERSDLSSSVGLLVGYSTGHKITIQSGIVYSAADISIDPTKIYAEKDNAGGAVKFRYNTSSGYGYLLPSFNSSPSAGDSLYADGANHTLHYISVPFIVRYKIGHKKLTFNPGAGISFNFLTRATLTTDLVDQLNREKEFTSKLEGIKKFNASFILTPALQYRLTQKISITAMPYFKYSLGAINKGNVVKTYPYTLGCGIGMEYKF